MNTQQDTKSFTHSISTEYASLVESARLLEEIKLAISAEDRTYISPAWTMVHHAQRHITQIAENTLRNLGQSDKPSHHATVLP